MERIKRQFRFMRRLGLDFSNLSQYRDVMSEVVRLKVIGHYKIKKRLGELNDSSGYERDRLCLSLYTAL